MEDDNLILLLNSNASPTSHSATPIQNRREPLVDIVENDANDSIVTMTCLNDRIPSLPPSNGKRHFEDIKLVRPTSATSQGSRTKKAGKNISYAPHLTSGGNRNSTDNLIQSSIDVTLSSESSRDDQALRARPGPIPNDDELGIVTIFGAEDNGERENEYPTDNNSACRFWMFFSSMKNCLFVSRCSCSSIHTDHFVESIDALSSAFHARRANLTLR